MRELAQQDFLLDGLRGCSCTMKRVLIVEDDNDLNTTISKYLRIKEFSCESVYDGQKALDIVYEKHFDLVILDIKLPSLNGFEVASGIRENSSVPIIFLTSLNSEKDIEKGFLNGGDDYITKPFSLSELYLRVEAILRRVYHNKKIIKIGTNIEFDILKSSLYKDKINIHLTQKELRLLELFLQNQGRIISRDEIFENLYDFSEDVNEASLRVFINKLRKIIGKEKIVSIKNIGYRYEG